jgi:hypothetical protein
MPDLDSFSGSELTGVAVRGSTVVGVGLSGYPDNDVCAVWVSPG